MTDRDSLGPQGARVALGVFVALLVDGLDMQSLVLALPSLTKDLALSSVEAGALSTVTLLGMGAGGVLAGWLADRIGRARVTWWSVFVFTACTGLIAACRAYWQIALLRGVSGFGIAALYSVGSVLVAEYTPTRMRTTVLGTLQAGWSVGFVVAGLASSYLLPRYGWPPMFLCAIPAGLLALALLWGLAEPPSWRARSSRPRGAWSAAFATIWRDPGIRRTFLLWSAASIALQFSYYGANTWLPSYLVKDLGIDLRSMGWYVASASAMAAVAKVVIGVVADRVGRRTMWVVASLLTAAYLPLLVHAATASNAAVLLLVFGAVYSGPYAVNSTYMAESFPAAVRGTAVATSYNVGRIGSTLSPLLIGVVASRYSIGLGIGLLGISYAACALVPGLFIKEKMFDPKAAEAAPAAEPSASA
jgi:AAHS family cis,cis-muconate transporter-like MFS transporter